VSIRLQILLPKKFTTKFGRNVMISYRGPTIAILTINLLVSLLKNLLKKMLWKMDTKYKVNVDTLYNPSNDSLSLH